MSRTLACIQVSRCTILALSLTFIVLSIFQFLHLNLIHWPQYPPFLVVIVDIILAFGILAGLTQHLKTLIFFSWFVALIFLLIFFGNTVSSQFQSDFIGMLFLFVMCVLGFTDAICIIRYRLPSEEGGLHHHVHSGHSNGRHHNLQAHFQQAPMMSYGQHPAAIAHLVPPFKAPPPIFTGDIIDSLPAPPPPPSIGSNGHSHHRQHPPPQHLALHHHSASSGRGTSGSVVQSPVSPLPTLLPLNSGHNCNYASKNDPQFHAV